MIFKFKFGNQILMQTITQFYPDGKLSFRFNYLTNKQHGLQETWYESALLGPEGTHGKPRYKFNYKDGQKHGLQEYWYPSPDGIYEQRAARENYVDGIKDGLQEFWYEGTNQLGHRERYIKGQLHGVQEYWIHPKSLFQKDSNSPIKRYYKYGNEISKEEYEKEIIQKYCILIVVFLIWCLLKFLFQRN